VKNRLAVELAATLWLQDLSSRLVGMDDLHPLLEEILDAAIEITTADMGCIHLLDVTLGKLIMEATRALAQPCLDFLSSIECNECIFRDSIQQRQRVIIEDVFLSAVLAGQPELEILLSSGIRSLQLTPLFSRGGRLVGALSTYYAMPQRLTERDLRLLDLLARQAADLIERAQTQKALWQSEERLRLTAEAAEIGTFDANPLPLQRTQKRRAPGPPPPQHVPGSPLQREIFWSPELKNIVGVPPNYVPEFATPGEDPLLVHPDDRERIATQAAAAGTPESNGRIEQEYRIVRPDRAVRWVAVKGRVFFDVIDGQKQPVRISGTVLDITARKESQEALIRTEKLASAGRMAASVAHEINNPLAAVTNAVFLAAIDPSLSERTRNKLELAQRELERVAHLTRQTLAFYRETSLPAWFRLSEVAESAIELYQPKLNDKRILLERRYAPDDYVCAVAGEVRQVISNLLANAIDAVSEDGRIWFRTTVSMLKSPRRMVGFTIADSGAGVAAEELARVFEPFFTTKEVVGTGLGLWIAKELILKSQGAIRVRSRPGKGTVFRLWLPAEPEPVSEQASQQSGVAPPVSPSTRVA
jgi:signal transduction histidine kinase